MFYHIEISQTMGLVTSLVPLKSRWWVRAYHIDFIMFKLAKKICGKFSPWYDQKIKPRKEP
jgi:hypothetical protein